MSTMLRPKLSAARYVAGQRHKFTVTEFNHMGDMGLLEGLRAYLIDGEIRENGPMDPPHATSTDAQSTAAAKRARPSETRTSRERARLRSIGRSMESRPIIPRHQTAG